MIEEACTIRGEFICPTLLTTDAAAVGTTQDGKVIIVPVDPCAIGVDMYNGASTGGVSKTLHCSSATDSDHVPCAIVSYGLSFDANFGFPIKVEESHMLKCGTCPEWKSGVVVCES